MKQQKYIDICEKKYHDKMRSAQELYKQTWAKKGGDTHGSQKEKDNKESCKENNKAKDNKEKIISEMFDL